MRIRSKIGTALVVAAGLCITSPAMAENARNKNSEFEVIVKSNEVTVTSDTQMVVRVRRDGNKVTITNARQSTRQEARRIARQYPFSFTVEPGKGLYAYTQDYAESMVIARMLGLKNPDVVPVGTCVEKPSRQEAWRRCSQRR